MNEVVKSRLAEALLSHGFLEQVSGKSRDDLLEYALSKVVKTLKKLPRDPKESL